LIYILSSDGLIFSIGESISKLHTVEFVALQVVVMSSLTGGIFFPLERGKTDSPCPFKKKQILPWRHAENIVFQNRSTQAILLPILCIHEHVMGVSPYDDILRVPLVELCIPDNLISAASSGKSVVSCQLWES
jgi:hypothetical protein